MAHFGGSWCIFGILRLIFSPRRWFQGAIFTGTQSPREVLSRGFRGLFWIHFPYGQFTTTWNPHSHPKLVVSLVRELGTPKMAETLRLKALFFELHRYKLRYMNYKKVTHRNLQTVACFLASQPFFNMKTEFMADEFRNFSFHGQTSKVSVWKPEKSKMLRISHPSISTQNRGGKPIFVHPKQMVWKSKVQWRKQSKQGWIFVTFHLGPLWGWVGLKAWFVGISRHAVNDDVKFMVSWDSVSVARDGHLIDVRCLR